MGIFLFLFGQVHDCAHLFHDAVIIFLPMGHKAVAAILNAVFQIPEVSAAPIAQRIQRTIAEKAVEILRVRLFMARKILTLFILKKSVIGHDQASLL